jgi:hypothetical protein
VKIIEINIREDHLNNFNYELNIHTTHFHKNEVIRYFNCENIDKRIKYKTHVVSIILFFKSIYDICKLLNISFNVAKKMFYSSSKNKKVLRKDLVVQYQILPNEINCLIDLIAENEYFIGREYNIYLNQPNDTISIENFLGISYGSVNQLLKEHGDTYLELLNKKGIYDSNYCTNLS